MYSARDMKIIRKYVWPWFSRSTIEVRWHVSHFEIHNYGYVQIDTNIESVLCLEPILVAGIGTRDHITPVLRSLHWLPIRLRIQYKLCVLMHQVHIGRSPRIPGRHDDSHRRSTRSWKTPFRQQFPIQNPKTETQVWWAGFLVRWTECVELTSV